VTINKVLRDKAMAAYLSDRLSTLGAEDKVFRTSGASMATYMKSKVGGDFKVKDLRTWNGTAVAKHLISKEDTPDSLAGLEDQKRRISTAVSKHLGNTQKIALEAYIDPLVWKHKKATTTKLSKA
jgi:DNA topoisomerase IB